MRKYLVCYDYGMGGLWWWISAKSAGEITAAYRDVIVFDKPPTWWTEDNDRLASRRSITDPPDGALALLAREIDKS